MATKQGWDRKIPFETLSKKLLEDFNLLISEWYRKNRKRYLSKQLIYLTIAIIQLYNGLRAGEAVEAFKEWINTGKDEVIIRVEKRKDKDAWRYAVIPAVVRFNRNVIERALDLGFSSLDEIKKKNYEKWFLVTYNINTHTLRKAWESYVARNLNKDLALITAYQGRKTVESHLAYLRQEEAKEEIKKVVDRVFNLGI